MKKLFLLFCITNSFLFAQNINTQKLDRFFKKLEDEKFFMGSVSLVKNNQLIYEKSIGYSNIDKQIKNCNTTTYNIGSISKTFTAVLIFKTIEQEKLKLTQSLSDFFPSIKNSKQITILDLLYHRSGIANFTDSKKYLTWNTKPISKNEFVKKISDLGSIFKPKSMSQYSNSNYILLSFILETIFNKNYASILKEQLTTPLQLTQTWYGTANETQSYSFQQNWKKQPVTHHSATIGAGGIISTPTDLTKFITALFNHKIIKPENLAQMKTVLGKYGMGLFKIPFYEHLGYGHTGSVDGFKSTLSYFEKEKIIIAITANGEQNNINDIAIVLLNEVFEKKYSLSKFHKNINLKPYLGVYSCSQLPLNITISENENKQLVGQATGQSSFILTPTLQPHKFEFKQAGIAMIFISKKQKMMFFQGGAKYQFVKK